MSRAGELVLTGARLPRRFVIVTSGRTGSHLLVDLLDQQPGVKCDGEIFVRRVRWPNCDINARAVRAKRSGALAYGFKVHLNHIAVVQGRDPADWFRRLHQTDWTIFHLLRANLLHQAISAQRAWRGEYHYEAGAVPKFEPLECDPVAILATMSFIEDALRRTRHALSAVPATELVYERDLASEVDQRRTVTRVCDQLGLDSVWSPSHYARVQPPETREMLANYDEVARVLENTRYAPYLHDRGQPPAITPPPIPDFPGPPPADIG